MSRTTGLVAAARWGPVYRSTTPTMLAGVNGVPDDQIGLAQQIAADLLPEAGDSWAVEAEQGL